MSRLPKDTSITSVLQIILKISVGQSVKAHNIQNIYAQTYISETTEISSLLQDPVLFIIVFISPPLRPDENSVPLVTPWALLG